MSNLQICKHGNGYGYCFKSEEYCLESPCPDEELIEYEPVRHGRWIFHEDGRGTCDQCHFTQKHVYDDDNHQNYCGVCGAKMDGGDAE